jgi:hypothetical protein
MTRRVRLEPLEVVGARHEATRRLRAVRRRLDRDLPRLVGRRVVQPQARAAGIDDPLAVALRLARVVAVVVGVPAHVAAVGAARIEIADALAVAEEVEALADPHRRGHVAGEVVEAAERAGAFGVDPDRAGASAAVTLPACRVVGVAADRDAAAGAEGDVVDLAEAKGARRAARRRDGERLVIAEERLTLRRHVGDLAGRRPAAHLGVGAEPGQPSGLAALRGHDVNFGVMLVAADESEPAAVGRQARRRRLREARGQAARDAAGRGDRPQVVVGDEGDAVALQRRVAQVGESIGALAALGRR